MNAYPSEQGAGNICHHNMTIDVMRLVFSIGIMFYHSVLLTESRYTALFKGGTIGVEFFFIVSGYLMASSAYRAKPVSIECLGSDTVRFLSHKVAAIIPYYVFAWVLSFLVYHAPGNFHPMPLFKNLVYSFWPTFFINMTGLDGVEIVGATWYLSAMLLAMVALWPLLRVNKNFFVWTMAPLLMLFLYGYLFKEIGNISPQKWNGFVYVGMFRAFAGLCLGSFCYGIANKIRTFRWSKFARGLLTAVELGGYVAALFIMQLSPGQSLKVAVLLFAISATISFSNQGFTPSRGRGWLRDASTAIYLCHERFAWFVSRVLPSTASYEIKLLCYLTLSIVSAAGCMLFVWLYRKNAGRFQRALKKLFLAENGD